MRGSSEAPQRPAVSIILPTYDRARFLPQAFESIRVQTFANWELIIVDDGSTDDTPQVVRDLSAVIPSVHYIRQENQGAYAARNTGLDHASGRYIAFFDSDDRWLPHHLQNCVDALEWNPVVDWVYGACRIVDHATGRTIEGSTFHPGGQKRRFLKLRTHHSGPLRIVVDQEVKRCMILYGLYSGLQNSVIRRRLFDAGQRFEAASRNEAEDQLFVIRSLSRGCTMAYFDAVHVIYHVHAANSSAAGSAVDFARQSRVLRLLAEGYERALNEQNWKTAERSALRQRLKQEYFWKLGYTTLWQNGRREEAIEMFRKGLSHWPWDLRCWKTYLGAAFRSSLPSRIDRVLPSA